MIGSLCTSLVFLNIPDCLYNSTMHSDAFFISLICNEIKEERSGDLQCIRFETQSQTFKPVSCFYVVPSIGVLTRAQIAKRASDVMTQTNKPKWRTTFLKHFLKQPVVLKHFFETKTSPRFPLLLSEHADVV